MEVAHFASTEVGKYKINPEMSMYTWAFFDAHTYLYQADVLGTGNTAKGCEYEDSTSFSKSNNPWTVRSNCSNFSDYLCWDETGMLLLILHVFAPNDIFLLENMILVKWKLVRWISLFHRSFRKTISYLKIFSFQVCIILFFHY